VLVLQLQIQRELKSKLEFQAKANEEVAALQREIDEQEKLLGELKRKFNSINTLVTEIKQLKAVRQQVAHENQKAYAELKQEFEGAAAFISLVFVCDRFARRSLR
jgi:chromosome segregation ATPase